jgi:redox-sensitive bicupin YhaK (pirin superfamily)
MSYHGADDPRPGDPFSCDAIDTVIVPRAADLGSFEVRRALPSAKRQMIGPFIFFDQMGPSEFLLGAGMDVRPHPHIGLSTVTYLFDGEIMHRDSLGTALPIRPGELNWMTAGRGITHSERTAPELRATGSRLFGIQSWVALSAKDEEKRPRLRALRRRRHAGAHGRGQGRAGDRRDGARGHLARPDLERDVSMPTASSRRARACRSIPITTSARSTPCRARSRWARTASDRDSCSCFRPGDRITVRAVESARFLMLGGEPMDGPRHIWWNFVSSRKDRIDQAKADWRAGRFDSVPGEHEFIPLPEPEAAPQPPVRYP